MRIQRNTRLLIEPPSVATGDIAFNLIVFFLVCAAVEPDGGRRQDIPAAQTQAAAQEQSDNPVVELTRQGIAINGKPVPEKSFLVTMKQMLAPKKRPEDRVVVVKSSKDTPYEKWIDVTGWIEEAGGVTTLQLEEVKTTVIGGGP